MYSACIQAEDPELIFKVFAPEDRSIQGRAQYEIKKKKGKAVFEIKAKDSVALRTMLNSITKMLTVIEKTKVIR